MIRMNADEERMQQQDGHGLFTKHKKVILTLRCTCKVIERTTVANGTVGLLANKIIVNNVFHS